MAAPQIKLIYFANVAAATARQQICAITQARGETRKASAEERSRSTLGATIADAPAIVIATIRIGRLREKAQSGGQSYRR